MDDTAKGGLTQFHTPFLLTVIPYAPKDLNVDNIVIWRPLGLKFKMKAPSSKKKVSYNFWLKTLKDIIARLKFLYGQSVRFPASFPCLSFPVPFLYIARTKAVLTGLKAY